MPRMMQKATADQLHHLDKFGEAHGIMHAIYHTIACTAATVAAALI